MNGYNGKYVSGFGCTRIVLYVRTRYGNVETTLSVPSRCFSADLTCVYFSRYYIRRVERECRLMHGDSLIFSFDAGYTNLVRVYRDWLDEDHPKSCYFVGVN